MDVSQLRLAMLALFNAFFQYSLQLEMIISNSTTQVTLKQEDVIKLFSLLCYASSPTINFNQPGHIKIIEDNQSSQGCNKHDYNDACVQTSYYESFFCTFNTFYRQINFVLYCADKLPNEFVIKTPQTRTCYKDHIVLYWSEPTVKLQLNSQPNDWMLVNCSVNNISSEESDSINDHKKPTDTNMLGLIIGLSVGGFLLLAAIIIVSVIIYRRANRKHQVEKQNLATSDTGIKHKPIGHYEEIDDVLNNGYSLAQPGVCQEKERTQDLPVKTSETDVTSQYNPIDTYSTIDPKTSAPPIVVPVTKRPDPSAADVNRVHIGGTLDGDETYDFKNVYSKLGQNNNQVRQNYDEISTLKATIESQSQSGSVNGQTNDMHGSNVISLGPSVDNMRPPTSDQIYSSI